ncbi:magnesium transporter MRS2-I-like isoform X1 [Sesamum indicum]|uniref:Magnesium transporter n=1 Tax=Sesamum indicum TaxID=4182 RepID=A0A8M8V0Q3_SESIN|nr:magnesium transporter MRS2-I-like isoform X1 [Sesamum indicum]XP_020549930.1 magnesium transporter MRS2-I-like isoform X1 [Sesamum indicum]
MAEEDGFIVEAQMSFKKKGAVSRSWMVLDGSGQGVVLDLDKYDIMRRVPINARDLRILDPLLSYPCAILGREKAIVLNLEHIKAIITIDEVLLRDPLDDNVLPIVEELQRRLPLAIGRGEGEEEELPESRNSEAGTEQQTEFPFEFRALEVALEGICSSLDAQTRELEVAAYPALDELTAKTSSRNLDRVRKLKSSMTRLTSRVQKVRDELEQLLDDDDDMADLYLSRKSAVSASSPTDFGNAKWQLTADESPTISSKISRNSSRTSAVTSSQEENNVEELEMLLEAYFVQIESTMNKLTTLREYIDDTEDYINIQLSFPSQLDNHRNQLIQLELFLSSGTVCLSMYSLVAAIFGMNIPYPWRENHGYLFKWVVMLTVLACGSFFLSIITYARHKGLVGSN